MSGTATMLTLPGDDRNKAAPACRCSWLRGTGRWWLRDALCAARLVGGASPVLALVIAVGVPAGAGAQAPSEAPSERVAVPQEPMPSTVRTGRARFLDPEDGQLDLSHVLENPRGFLPVPVVVTEPAVGCGGGAVGLFLRPREEAGVEGWARPDISRRSVPSAR